MKVMVEMNPACMKRKKNISNLVLVAVFWSNSDWVASELVAKD